MPLDALARTVEGNMAQAHPAAILAQSRALGRRWFLPGSAWFQATPLADCFTNPTLVTGSACDAGGARLFWTNGRGTMRWNYAYNPAGPSVSQTPGACCIQVTPFCGQFLIPMSGAMIVFSPNTPVGGSPCLASTTWFLPLPGNPIFAGTPLTSQCVSLCLPSGTAMSNCLSYVLQ
ncbi:MAG: hypothetical protein ACK539_01020 [Planctomycetota bacterium]